MHFLYSWTRAFLLIFLINFSNIILNVEGANLGDNGGIFTWHTLGNVGSSALSSGGHSYAIIEVCTAILLLVALFQTREQMFQISERIQRGATRQLTAADFSIMVSHVPPKWGPDRLRAFFERWGTVVHVGISLNYRKLILNINQTQMLRNKHTDNLLHLASRMEALKNAQTHAERLENALHHREAREAARERARLSSRSNVAAAEPTTPAAARTPAAATDLERGSMSSQCSTHNAERSDRGQDVCGCGLTTPAAAPRTPSPNTGTPRKTHASILTPRGLITETLMAERARLRTAVKEARRAAKLLGSARANARNSHAKLNENDKHIKALMRKTYEVRPRTAPARALAPPRTAQRTPHHSAPSRFSHLSPQSPQYCHHGSC